MPTDDRTYEGGASAAPMNLRISPNGNVEHFPIIDSVTTPRGPAVLTGAGPWFSLRAWNGGVSLQNVDYNAQDNHLVTISFSALVSAPGLFSCNFRLYDTVNAVELCRMPRDVFFYFDVANQHLVLPTAYLQASPLSAPGIPAGVYTLQMQIYYANGFVDANDRGSLTAIRYLL